MKDILYFMLMGVLSFIFMFLGFAYDYDNYAIGFLIVLHVNIVGMILRIEIDNIKEGLKQ